MILGFEPVIKGLIIELTFRILPLPLARQARRPEAGIRGLSGFPSLPRT
jgi:hypothetical protein